MLSKMYFCFVTFVFSTVCTVFRYANVYIWMIIMCFTCKFVKADEGVTLFRGN